MYKSCFPAVIAFFLVFSPAWIHGQTEPPDVTPASIQLKLNTDEADAVLAILDKRAAGNAVTDSDWRPLFSTEPYIRLKKARGQLGARYGQLDPPRVELWDSGLGYYPISRANPAPAQSRKLVGTLLCLTNRRDCTTPSGPTKVIEQLAYPD
ncbi:MAG: hypothetical protein WCA20_03310 [Candidatus Sulfotelmatobacter sp.]